MRKLAVTFILAGTLSASGTTDETPNFDGDWSVQSSIMAGAPIPESMTDTMKLSIKGEQYTSESMGQVETGTLTFNFDVEPYQIDISAKDGPLAGQTLYAIGKLDGDTATFAYNLSGDGTYPTEFKSTMENGLLLMEMTR